MLVGKTLKLVIFFLYAEKTSDEYKDYLIPSAAQRCTLFKNWTYFLWQLTTDLDVGATGDRSLASSMFAGMLRCAWGCGISSSKESCRSSLACLGKIVLGSLMCGGREVC